MRFITSLTRMWLTRKVRPFTFKNEYDRMLPFGDCEKLGLYIHIPFCKSICNFCPYCKVRYSEKECEKYIDSLIREIHLVGSGHTGRKKVTSLYFGGGTPALAAHRIKEIIDALKEHFIITEGIGLELHPDNVNTEVLQILKDAGITKISIGIQSFCSKYQNILGRKKIDTLAVRSALAAVPFETVSMDFIFALPGQTYDDLKADIDAAFALGANHVAIYPFIDFTFTESSATAMPKKEKRELLDAITRYCLGKGYSRSSIWTFSNEPDAEYSSMTRETFLGFGCSATSLLKEQFKINTFDVEAYCDRIRSGKLATSLTIRFTRRQRMLYWLFWTAYTTRVKASDFESFFGVPLKRMYGFELWLAKRLGFIREHAGTYEMTLKGAFYYHYYENFYTLSYIDKMWGILRKEAFPKRIKL
ncbi:MAG: radical SAM protein [Clostridia bacterium]|nr:radical SAM protein [Clostridia bacterium]